MSGAASDARVVGAGPNGLAAAIELSERGSEVLVLEAAEQAGGGCRTAELTLPGYRHDVCSTVYPMAAVSPFFRRQPLGQHGLQWIHPPLPAAHPLDGGRAVCLHRGVEETAAGLGADGPAYLRLFGPLVAAGPRLFEDLLRPALRWPSAPLAMARFGLRAAWPAALLARLRFAGAPARALFAGLAGHAIFPLGRPLSAAYGLVLGAAGHAAGYPIPRGGAGSIAAALEGRLAALGGRVETGRRVTSLGELEGTRPLLLDVTPAQLLRLAGGRLPAATRRAFERFRYGPGVFKLDWALDAPIPWEARECGRAGTVHLGGTLEEIEASEAAVGRGEPPERPFVILAQPSLFDDTRAPAGGHVAWAYCHVPSGSREDMTERIEAQIERFAPGFRSRVRARHTMGPEEMEAYDPNYVGGDIAAGAQDGLQSLLRPRLARDPYATGIEGVWLCSASTPPGAGVHGMCGVNAARSALAVRG